MTTVTLRPLGGSVVMAVPKQILAMLHLSAGSEVEISVENDRLIVQAKTSPRYTLAELLAQCNDENMAITDEDRTWLDAAPVGKEAL
ncbi:MAG: AbrB/MazE/SpoVT family DNA-binding domain-containing protein [Burkholderiaceae bacterium]